jgi:hypothetical protein
VQQLQGETIDETGLQIMYAVGRQVHFYADFWDKNKHPNNDYIWCINVYRNITWRSRQAALCTVMTLMTHGIVRDVAKLIGKIVYATREHNADAWYGTLAAATKKTKKQKI